MDRLAMPFPCWWEIYKALRAVPKEQRDNNHKFALDGIARLIKAHMEKVRSLGGPEKGSLEEIAVVFSEDLLPDWVGASENPLSEQPKGADPA